MFLHTRDLPSEFFRSLNNSRVLSREEEQNLFRRIKRGNRPAYETMIANNQKLVLSIVRRYCKYDFQVNDLMQEGNIGLMRAIRKFNENRSVKFSTYATWWIRHHIVSAIQYKFTNFRLPVRKLKILREFNNFMIQFLQHRGRIPQPRDIAAAMNMRVGEVNKIMKVTRGYFRFDVQATDDSDQALPFDEISNEVSADQDDQPAARAISNDLKEKLTAVLRQLPDKVRKMITYRYGFDDGLFHTLKETGDKFGMSAEAIRLYEKKAFDRIRLRNHVLREYL